MAPLAGATASPALPNAPAAASNAPAASAVSSASSDLVQKAQEYAEALARAKQQDRSIAVLGAGRRLARPAAAVQFGPWRFWNCGAAVPAARAGETPAPQAASGNLRWTAPAAAQQRGERAGISVRRCKSIRKPSRKRGGAAAARPGDSDAIHARPRPGQSGYERRLASLVGPFGGRRGKRRQFSCGSDPPRAAGFRRSFRRAGRAGRAVAESRQRPMAASGARASGGQSGRRLRARPGLRREFSVPRRSARRRPAAAKPRHQHHAPRRR